MKREDSFGKPKKNYNEESWQPKGTTKNQPLFYSFDRSRTRGKIVRL